MKFERLFSENYTVTFLNCMRQQWQDGESWSSIGRPKERDLLFTPIDCSVSYMLPSGEVLTAREGDVIYIPRGSEYTVTFTASTASRPTSIAINHHLFCDAQLRDTELSIVSCPDAIRFFINAEQLTKTNRAYPARFISLIYEIITALGEHLTKADTNESRIVASALEYLHAHLTDEDSVSNLARVTGVSEVYLRRVFKRHMGMTPIGYRTRERLRRAAEYLRFSDLAVGRIALELGFSDSPHLVRSFRDQYGVTPYEYRKSLIN